MAGLTTAGRRALRAEDRERLRSRAVEAVRRARRRGEALAAMTVPLPAGADPTAITAASRRPGEPWFTYEQSDRDGFALATLGCVAALDEGGPERFARVAARWRALAEHAACDDPDGPRRRGPVAVGGCAFAADGGGAPHWAGYEPASLHVPEAALVRRGDEVRLTLAALARPDDVPDDLVARLEARAGELRERALPLLDPDPAGRFRVAGAMPPEHYEAAVARAVERIRSGALAKIVLAREVQVHAPTAHDVAAVLGVLREGFPSCHVFCVARGDSAFVAASPELLVRREGLRAGTLALGGSTGRSGDPAGRRPPRRAAPAVGQGPRGAGDRRAADRPRAAPAQRLGHDGRRAGRREDGEHPAPRDADPRPARPSGRGGRARRRAAPAPGGRRRAAGCRRAADPGARGPRPRLVRRAGRLDRPRRGRRVLRRAALRAADRRRRALLRRRRRRARLRPGCRARRDRGQAPGAAACPRGLSLAFSPDPRAGPR